ncbi:hypothetical protein DB346_03350 [Verrucomicrobia bacterium LW23]|nr:hypothetical protein DB346_03350 [Verrucomicrobia bacterium LW23]
MPKSKATRPPNPRAATPVAAEAPAGTVSLPTGGGAVPITQQEIVSRLGISRGTLHRILVGSPLVKTSTRERVLRELREIDYVPNAVARGLKTRRTHSIGIIGPAAFKTSNIDKINALHIAARARGYSVVFGYSDGSPQAEVTCIRELRSKMVDGFIALSRGLSESLPHYKALQKAGLPLVQLYPLAGLEADCVYVDTRRAFADLTRHLIRLGHSRIALMLDASASQFTVNRELGYRDAMKAAGIALEEDWIIHATPDGSPLPPGGPRAGDPGWDASDYQYGFWGTSQVLARKERPTALVCFSDEYAIGALRAADLAGVRVPSELALVGYDDKEPAKFARVPLTTMHQPDERIGEAAVSLLADRIEGRIPTEGPVTRPLEATLVVRDSCGARARRE